MKHNWDYKPVSEIFDTVTDFVAAGSFADLRDNVIYNNEKDFAQLIRTTDLKNNFSNQQFVYVNEHAFNYLWRVNLSEECIILPNIGNCGEVYYLHPSMLVYPNNVLGPNAIMVRSKSHNHKYLAFALKGSNFQRQLSQIISQVAQSKFNKTNLKKLLLPVPPMEVQQQIVTELDKINEVIENCRELLRNLDALAQSLFYNYFGDPIANPKGWETDSFGNLCKLSAGGDKPTDTEKEPTKEKNVPIYSNGIENEGLYGYTSFPKIDIPALTISGRGTLGVPFIRKNPFVPIIRLIVAIPQKNINLIFLFYLIKILKLGGKGAAIPQLTVPMIKDLLLPVPPLQLQEKFAEHIEQIDAQKKAVEETIANMQTLLDSRMDYWFN